MGRLDETPVRLKALAMVNDLLIHYGLKGFIKDVEDAEEPNNEEEQEWADIEAALGIEHDNASVSVRQWDSRLVVMRHVPLYVTGQCRWRRWLQTDAARPQRSGRQFGCGLPGPAA